MNVQKLSNILFAGLSNFKQKYIFINGEIQETVNLVRVKL